MRIQKQYHITTCLAILGEIMCSNITMEFHGSSLAYSWFFTDFHLLVICEIPWISMPVVPEFHGTPAYDDSVEFHEIPAKAS